MSETVPDEVPLSRNRDFFCLWGGQTFSELGSSMSTLVFPLVGYAVTGSVRTAGLISAFTAAARLLFALPAGALVDRWSRRRVLLAFNVIGALAFALLALAGFIGKDSLTLLLTVAFIAGLVDVFLVPALSASVKTVVPASQRTTASAYSNGRAFTASLVGPPAGGALLAVGRSIPFLMDAVSYLAATTLVLFVRSPLPAPTTERKHLLREIAEGMSYLWRNSILRGFMLWGAVFNLGATTVWTATVLRLASLHVSATHIGLVESLAGVGGIAGSFAAPRIVKRSPTGRLVIATGLLVAGLYALTGFFTSPWFIGAFMAVAMFFLPAANAGVGGYFSHVVPHALQGRVSGARGFIARGLQPFGPMLAGVCLASLGGMPAILIGSAILALSSIPAALTRDIQGLAAPSVWSQERTD